MSNSCEPVNLGFYICTHTFASGQLEQNKTQNAKNRRGRSGGWIPATHIELWHVIVDAFNLAQPYYSWEFGVCSPAPQLSSIGSAMEGTCGVPPACTKKYGCLQGEKVDVELGMCTACYAEVKNVLPPGPSALQEAFDRDTFNQWGEIATRWVRRYIMGRGQCDWCGQAYDISGGSVWQTPWGTMVPHCSDICMRSHAASNVIHAWQIHLMREHRRQLTLS